ncbi:hypothetical protein HELRODRAFT_171098 [Helobdella robusta]|uniref:EPS8 spectrin-like domain-containing protein n=1 Tax=Helobdella robusta TaxID=6412 RepID=T1F3T2_HELRO|nr:hypothetical protein HELRODRAFT_171098 [Helobdella robusta]ESO05468.1 hypothetical protein HELRODRAFT_171098 [Helobdella robusta]
MPSDGAQYEVDHLLNLEITPSSLAQQGTEGDRNSTSSSSSLSPQLVISRPEEAIIRLHELDRTKCFRPVRVILKLDPTEMKIIDKNTKNVAERIPYYSITPCPETFVRSVMDKCGNLVLMKIEDYLQIAPAQFYIFQFDTKKDEQINSYLASSISHDTNISSTVCLFCILAGERSNEPVAKEFLKNFDAAKTKDSKNGPPPAAAASAKQPLVGTSSSSSRTSINMADWYDEEGAKGTAMATIKYKQKSLQLPPARTVFQQQNDDQQQRDVYLELLNRCLDEVELLVTKLQDVADAYKQLEERKKNSRKSGFGDGMLVMRARPPTREEFITVFQYIKLSFNLLAKLKGHINNPNSPEIVHYLFQPLDLIVEASCQIVARNEKPIWEEVITPLLNDETITFLEDCMFTKEVELWKCLGTAWNIGAGEKFVVLIDFFLFPDLFGCCAAVTFLCTFRSSVTGGLQIPKSCHPCRLHSPQQPQFPQQPANKRQSQMAMQQIRQEIQQVEQQQQYFPPSRPQLPSPTAPNDNMIYQQIPLSQQQLHDQQPQQQQVDYLISQGKEYASTEKLFQIFL